VRLLVFQPSRLEVRVVIALLHGGKGWFAAIGCKFPHGLVLVHIFERRSCLWDFVWFLEEPQRWAILLFHGICKSNCRLLVFFDFDLIEFLLKLLSKRRSLYLLLLRCFGVLSNDIIRCLIHILLVIGIIILPFGIICIGFLMSFSLPIYFLIRKAFLKLLF
jgi:hypothetical protein